MTVQGDEGDMVQLEVHQHALDGVCYHTSKTFRILYRKPNNGSAVQGFLCILQTKSMIIACLYSVGVIELKLQIIIGENDTALPLDYSTCHTHIP